MAGNVNPGMAPEITYDDDGVSTIRISSSDNKKGHILSNQPGAVQYTAPQVNKSETKAPVTENYAKGQIIEPVLVRERPDGEEIIKVEPLYDYKKHHPPIVPKKPKVKSSDLNDSNNNIGVHVINTTNDETEKPSSKDETDNAPAKRNSILKKSGQKRNIQRKKISWNENVNVQESDDKNKVSVKELQKEDHVYNPISEPRDEAIHKEPVADAHPDNGSAISSDPLPSEASSLPPNGGIPGEVGGASQGTRHVPPYGAEHFIYPEDRMKEQEDNRWCMRITICILIFLLTFAVIGVIVLGLLFARSMREDYNQDREDLQDLLNLQQPSTSQNVLFPNAWYSGGSAVPTYYLVTGTDSMNNRSPDSKGLMTWHKGKPMKVTVTDSSGSTVRNALLGDPTEDKGAVFILELDSRYIYTATIDGGEEYSLISFVSVDGSGDLSWS